MAVERARPAQPELAGNSEEHQFRSGIEDMLAISFALSGYTDSIEQMSDVLALAEKNDAQLRILMDLVKRIR